MDDFKKEQNGKENLNEELDQLAEKFQEELDKAQAESGENAAVQDWDGLVNNTYDVDGMESFEQSENGEDEQFEKFNAIPEEDLCQCCGENLRDKSISEDYEYCSECREIMKKFPINWKGPLMLILVFFGVLFSLLEMIVSLPSYTQFAEANWTMKQGKLQTAITSYQDLSGKLTELEREVPIAINEKICEALFKLGAPDYVTSLVEENYTGTKLEKISMGNINATYQLSKKFIHTAKAINEAVSTYLEMEPSEIDSNEAIAALDKLKSDANYEVCLIEYYKGYFAGVAGKTPAECLTYLYAALEANPQYGWLCYPSIAEYEFKNGSYENALKYGKLATSINSDSFSAYKIELAVMRINGKYDQALELANELVTKQPEPAEIYRQMAIIYLLQGKNKEALEAATEAFEAELNFDTVNTIALCYLANNDTKGYENTVSMLKEYGYNVNDIVVQYKDGKVTVADIFLKGKGDII